MESPHNQHKRFEARIRQILAQNPGKHSGCAVVEGGNVSMERGLIFPQAIIDDGAWTKEKLPAIGVVVDGGGHTRSIYAGLLVYAWLRAAEEGAMDAADIGPWCESLASNMENFAGDAAARGWSALALHVGAEPMKRNDWRGMAAEVFGEFGRAQQGNGALLAPAPGIHPETRWYDELVLLHAMSSYAVETRDAAVALAVGRAAEFNMMETQPDHATQQPWALFAFCENPATRIQAEQILHTAIMRGGTNLDATSLILLADALWCARSG